MVVNNIKIPNDKKLKQLYILLNTIRGEVPLFRDFGVDGRNIDKPITLIQLSIFTELESQIKKYIKGLKLISVKCFMEDNKLVISCEVDDNE